ncbi:MAG: ribonuclease R, partial [Methylocella sp.]
MKKSAGARESGQDIAEPAQTSHAAHDRGPPSRDEILAFIAGECEAFGGKTRGKIGKREIARVFNVKGPARIALKRMLKDLEADGAIERRRKSLHKPGVLQGVVLADMIARDRDGDLLAAPAEWDMGQGPAPQILVMARPKQKPGAPAPAPGDRALLRVELVQGVEPGEPAYTGRVIKLLPCAKTQVLGIFREDTRGGGRIVPVDKKNVNRGELSVGPGDEGPARDGDLVAVEVLRTGRLGLPAAKVRQRLGAVDNERAISLIAIHAHQIPHVFGPEVIAEAERARPAIMSHREDWRAIPLVTIDPLDAKDHD